MRALLLSAAGAAEHELTQEDESPTCKTGTRGTRFVSQLRGPGYPSVGERCFASLSMTAGVAAPTKWPGPVPARLGAGRILLKGEAAFVLGEPLIERLQRGIQ